MVHSTVKCWRAYEYVQEPRQWTSSYRYVSCDLDFVFKISKRHSPKGPPPKSQQQILLEGEGKKGFLLFALNLLKWTCTALGNISNKIHRKAKCLETIAINTWVPTTQLKKESSNSVKSPTCPPSTLGSNMSRGWYSSFTLWLTAFFVIKIPQGMIQILVVRIKWNNVVRIKWNNGWESS